MFCLLGDWTLLSFLSLCVEPLEGGLQEKMIGYASSYHFWQAEQCLAAQCDLRAGLLCSLCKFRGTIFLSRSSPQGLTGKKIWQKCDQRRAVLCLCLGFRASCLEQFFLYGFYTLTFQDLPGPLRTHFCTGYLNRTCSFDTWCSRSMFCASNQAVSSFVQPHC